MAHTLSANKRIRQTAKRRLINRDRRKTVKVEVKKFDALVLAGDKTAAAAEFKAVQKVLDRNSARGTLHKNAIARKKSRLAKRLNAIVAK